MTSGLLFMILASKEFGGCADGWCRDQVVRVPGGQETRDGGFEINGGFWVHRNSGETGGVYLRRLTLLALSRVRIWVMAMSLRVGMR